MTAEDDDFLSRWSRRKRAVAEEQPVVVAEPSPEPEAVPETEEDEADVLERLGLPVPETLGKGDDFSGFMANGVPQFLRKRALRVLWRSNPVLANLDGLNDYDDDFNAPELTQKVLATGYQVGRGFVKKVLEGDDGDVEADEDDELQIAEVEEDEPLDSKELSRETDAASDDVEQDGPVSVRPRRMRFDT